MFIFFTTVFMFFFLAISIFIVQSIHIYMVSTLLFFFYSYLSLRFQPIHLINYSLEIAKPGKLPSGKTEIPFEVPLKPKGNKTLYETYHGVFINVQVQNQNTCNFIYQRFQQSVNSKFICTCYYKECDKQGSKDVIHSMLTLPYILHNHCKTLRILLLDDIS